MDFIRYSKWDKKRGIRIPCRPSSRLAEETAIHTGDGYLTYSKRSGSYRFGVGFNRRNEKVYATWISRLIEAVYGYKPPIYETRIEVMSLAIGLFKHRVIGFPVGRRVGRELPRNIEWIMEKNAYEIAFIRGIFDTEGTIKKQGNTVGAVIKMRCPHTISLIHNILIDLGFKPKRYSWLERGRPVYVAEIIGKESIRHFLTIIKPNNPKHLARISMLNL